MDDTDSDVSLDEPSAPVAPKSNGTRAAKAKANKKLDAQAKALAEFQRQSSARTGRAAKRQQTDDETEFAGNSRTLGTRLSKRLRGAANEEEEWQQVPEEWLGDDEKPKAKPVEKKPVKTGLESDAESDLTDLSSHEGEELEPESEPPVVEQEEEEEAEEQVEEPEEEPKEEPEEEPAPGEFVEWEMVCNPLTFMFVY